MMLLLKGLGNIITMLVNHQFPLLDQDAVLPQPQLIDGVPDAVTAIFVPLVAY